MPDEPKADAADQPAKHPPRKQEPKPTGTKGEEISSQGQVDEGTRERTGGGAKEPPPVIGEP